MVQDRDEAARQIADVDVRPNGFAGADVGGIAVLEGPAGEGGELNRETAVGCAVDEGRDHDGDLGFVAEGFAGVEDG